MDVKLDTLPLARNRKGDRGKTEKLRPT